MRIGFSIFFFFLGAIFTQYYLLGNQNADGLRMAFITTLIYALILLIINFLIRSFLRRINRRRR